MASIEEKLDTLLERTVVLERLTAIVEQHDVILRGPNRDNGMVTDVMTLKGTMRVIKSIVIPVIVAFILSVAGFLYGLLTHTIVLGH